MRPLSPALCILAMAVCQEAHASEPSRDQLRAAEKINAVLNGRKDWAEVPGPCTIYAINKAMAFVDLGIDPSMVRIGIVRDEHQSRHAVAEIVSAGQTLVYDSRLVHPEKRSDLELVPGYRWEREFSLSDHPEERR